MHFLRSRGWLAILAFTVVLGLAAPIVAAPADGTTRPASSYAAWRNGPSKAGEYFPIAVWLQDPKNAPRYKAIGVNLYIGLWQGPTAAQLSELKKHGMPVICEQNEYALAHLDEPTIVGWMHGDEPDNAQPLAKGKGYGPPIPAEKIVEDYRKLRAADPTRPVLLNIGQGVAWDGWHGRGVRTNHPEDYPEYARGGDIVSFDIYPVVHDRPALAGKLWYVPRGVDRLRKWTRDEKVVWNCIECTRIGNPKLKPTPLQVKAEVWMSIIHGSRGIVYFCHQFQPRFIEAALLADDEMSKAVGAINRQVQALAPVLNSPAIREEITVAVDPPGVSKELAQGLGPRGVAVLAKRHEGALYLFAVRMENSPAKATFQVPGVAAGAKVRVIGEDRAIATDDGRFEGDFGPYAVHLYKVDQ